MLGHIRPFSDAANASVAGPITTSNRLIIALGPCSPLLPPKHVYDDQIDMRPMDRRSTTPSSPPVHLLPADPELHSHNHPECYLQST